MNMIGFLETSVEGKIRKQLYAVQASSRDSAYAEWDQLSDHFRQDWKASHPWDEPDPVWDWAIDLSMTTFRSFHMCTHT